MKACIWIGLLVLRIKFFLELYCTHFYTQYQFLIIAISWKENDKRWLVKIIVLKISKVVHELVKWFIFELKLSYFYTTCYQLAYWTRRHGHGQHGDNLADTLNHLFLSSLFILEMQINTFISNQDYLQNFPPLHKNTLKPLPPLISLSSIFEHSLVDCSSPVNSFLVHIVIT